MNEILKILVGFALVYLLCDTLLQTDKFKPYIQLIIGLGIVITLTAPVLKLLNSEFHIDYNTSVEATDDYRQTILEIWKKQTSSGIIKTTETILKEEFPEYRFTVRVIKQENEIFRIYITSYSILTDSEIAYVKKIISKNTGISVNNVHIYLQNTQENGESNEKQ